MDDDGGNKNPVEKRVEATPMRPPEFLARTEALGGYIFVCNNDTMQECLRRQMFGTTNNTFLFLNSYIYILVYTSPTISYALR